MDDIIIGKYRIRVTHYIPYKASSDWEDDDQHEEIDFEIIATTQNGEEIDVTDVFEAVGLFNEMYNFAIEKVTEELRKIERGENRED